MSPTVGWIGLGKLGLTCAAAFSSQTGVKVIGYDISPWPQSVLAGVVPPPREVGIDGVLKGASIELVDGPGKIVEQCDVVFVSVQTPHHPAYDGSVPAPAETRDFDYSHLCRVIADLDGCAREANKRQTVVVISTVLPGTFDGVLVPMCSDYLKLVYNPFFIAMGTAIQDFLSPEFVVIGCDEPEVSKILTDLYAPLNRTCPVQVTSFVNAEMVKIAYNTFISLKIVFANSVMEMADRLGGNCDVVSECLQLANRRLMSGAYLWGGMGDGGPCHPRDNIAMSHLAQMLGMSVDVSGFVTRARESQTRWLAEMAISAARMTGLPLVLLGKAFKGGTTLIEGSPGLLLAHAIRSAGIAFEHVDPLLDDQLSVDLALAKPVVAVVATHHAFVYQFCQGSVVLDPWGDCVDQKGVDIRRVGRHGS